MMETIQEILNFSVGKLTVGNIISALVIFLVCHAVIKALMGPIERLLDKLNVDLTLRGFLRTAADHQTIQSRRLYCRSWYRRYS